MAGTLFQTPWRQGRLYRALHRDISAYRGQSAGGHDENVMAKLSTLQPHGIGGLYRHIHPDRLFFWQNVEANRSLVRPHGALFDSCGDGPPYSRSNVSTFIIRVTYASFSKKSVSEACRALGRYERSSTRRLAHVE